MKNVSEKRWKAHQAYRRMCYVEMMKPLGSHPICLVHHSPYMSEENKRVFLREYQRWNWPSPWPRTRPM